MIIFTLLLLISWLPLRMLYTVSDVLWRVLYYVVRYRRKVADNNLKNAFPNKSDVERSTICKQYYRHMSDLLVEALYNLRTNPKQIWNHYHITNRELVDRYYEEGRSIILLSAHYNNWEYMVAGLNMMLRHHGVGVGKPLSSKSFGKRLTAKRSRFGTEIVDQHNVRDVFAYYHSHNIPTAYMMLCDQSPNDVHKCYWTHFFNQEAGFIYGAEYFARKYNYPVVFYKVEKVERGHYNITFSTLCDNPLETPQYYITKKYVSLLTQIINDQPQYWLWTHKRWKRTRPKEIPISD